MEIIKSGTWIGHLGRGLARRELQFLLQIAQGCTAKQIARSHDVEPGTVTKRISNAMFKLGVHRQSALVAEAMRREIILADGPNLRIPRHSDTQPTLIRTPVPRSFGQAVGAQRRRGGIVSPRCPASSISSPACASIRP